LRIVKSALQVLGEKNQKSKSNKKKENQIGQIAIVGHEKMFKILTNKTLDFCEFYCIDDLLKQDRIYFN